jgi:Rieske [2Fe-2S] domain
MMAPATFRVPVTKPRTTIRRSTPVRVAAAAWTSVALTKDALVAAGTTVVEVGDQKILFAAVDGEVFAVSNKCSHLGLPLIGKTSFFQGEVSSSTLRVGLLPC